MKGDRLKNDEVFKRRILGLVSYYKSVDDKSIDNNVNYNYIKDGFTSASENDDTEKLVKLGKIFR